jgi:hypothetical protein
LLSFTTRFFWSSPVVPWAMVVATVAPSILLWNRLVSAGTQDEPMCSRAASASA